MYIKVHMYACMFDGESRMLLTLRRSRTQWPHSAYNHIREYTIKCRLRSLVCMCVNTAGHIYFERVQVFQTRIVSISQIVQSTALKYLMLSN